MDCNTLINISLMICIYMINQWDSDDPWCSGIPGATDC